ncbi:MAG: DUF3349 domain-containing protein [Mycobacteriaceae bacterium]|nr:DUF3349 domain-containing protein [Mycobacteriaceae bacterium]
MTFLARIVAWTTAGYPEGVPGPDRVPLSAPLKRRRTDELPIPDDIERVQTRLAAKGWPLDDLRDGEERA